MQLLKSKILAKKKKNKIHESIIRPVIIYRAEVMKVTKEDEEAVKLADRKI